MRKCALPTELAALTDDQITQVNGWLDRFTYPKVQDLFLDAFKMSIGRMKLCRYNARRLKARALSGPGQLTAADLVAIKNGTPVPDTRLNKDVLLYQTLQMVRSGVKSAYHLRELHQIATYEERRALDERGLQIEQEFAKVHRRRADLREQELALKREVAAARSFPARQAAAARSFPQQQAAAARIIDGQAAAARMMNDQACCVRNR